MSNRKGIQLCYPFEEQRLKRWNSPLYIVQPKLDGDRCRAIFDASGHVTLLSSEEHEINSVPHIKDQLENMGLSSVELDGELYTHGASHQQIHGAVSRTVNLHSAFEEVEYHIFDIVSEDKQGKRLVALNEHIKNTQNVKKVPCDVKYSVDEIVEQMNTYIEQGYEGIIIRHPLAPYVRKRSVNIMKFKPRKDDWYVVTGVEEEISITGIPKNSLGALWLKGDEDEPFKVGSGSYLTRENRIELWKIRDSLIGRVAHIKYQHLTERKVPRFPVIVELVQPMFKK